MSGSSAGVVVVVGEVEDNFSRVSDQLSAAHSLSPHVISQHQTHRDAPAQRTADFARSWRRKNSCECIREIQLSLANPTTKSTIVVVLIAGILSLQLQTLLGMSRASSPEIGRAPFTLRLEVMPCASRQLIKVSSKKHTIRSTNGNAVSVYNYNGERKNSSI